MNYIDDIAFLIYCKTVPKNAVIDISQEDWRLYRIYAVLCLAKGVETQNIDVHDAWSAWRSDTNPEHVSCIPFDDLPSRTQEMDIEYRDAIRQVSKEQGEF